MASKSTLLALAALASAAAATAVAISEEFGGADDSGGEEAPATTGRRGRPPGAKNNPKEEEAPKGKTAAELKEICKDIIEDTEGGGPEKLKKLIAKHGGTKDGETRLQFIPEANQAAFLKDADALRM